MYCPANFIKSRRFHYKRMVHDRATWTEDQLELMNYKKNNILNSNKFLIIGTPLANNANFNDSHLNSLLFKNF